MTYVMSHDWFSMRVPPWREHVLPRLPRPFSWLEIGSYEGRSACWMLDDVMRDGDTITCVDLWLTSFDGYRADSAEARFDANTRGRVEKHKCASHEFLTLALAQGRRFDGVYIDGDHEARSVLEDSVLAWRLLKVGAVIVWDDYGWSQPASKKHLLPPKPAIDAFLDIYGRSLDVLHRGWQIIAVKKES